MLLNQVIEEQTSKQEKGYAITIGDFKINLSKRLPNFEKYDTINESNKLKLFANFYFPIEFSKVTYLEKQEKEVTYTVEQAKQMLTEKLEKEVKAQIQHPEAIVNTQINVKEEEGSIEVELIYEVLENIGTKEKILF